MIVHDLVVVMSVNSINAMEATHMMPRAKRVKGTRPRAPSLRVQLEYPALPPLLGKVFHGLFPVFLDRIVGHGVAQRA